MIFEKLHTVEAWQVLGIDWRNAPLKAIKFAGAVNLTQFDWVCLHGDDYYGMTNSEFRNNHKVLS